MKLAVNFLMALLNALAAVAAKNWSSELRVRSKCRHVFTAKSFMPFYGKFFVICIIINGDNNNNNNNV